MSDREVSLFNIEQPGASGCTHIEAVVRHTSTGEYRLVLAPYLHPIPGDTGLRSYPMSAGRSILLSTGRFSRKKLTDYATNQDVVSGARAHAADMKAS